MSLSFVPDTQQHGQLKPHKQPHLIHPEIETALSGVLGGFFSFTRCSVTSAGLHGRLGTLTGLRLFFLIVSVDSVFADCSISVQRLQDELKDLE